MGSPERAWRHWSPARLPGLDLLRARFVAQTFPPHTHDAFVIAAVSQGVEEFHHRGTLERAGPGTVALLNPDAAHTGQAGTPEGWTHHVLHPSPALFAEIAADTTAIRGTPSFSVTVAADPQAVGLVSRQHQVAESDGMLATGTLLRQTVGHLLTRYGSAAPRPQHPAPGPVPRRAPVNCCSRVCPPRPRSGNSPPSSERAPTRCYGPSGTPTGCRRTPGSPTPACGGHASFRLTARVPPTQPLRSVSRISRISTGISPASSASLPAFTSGNAADGRGAHGGGASAHDAVPDTGGRLPRGGDRSEAPAPPVPVRGRLVRAQDHTRFGARTYKIPGPPFRSLRG